jgi:hypothetical protein
MRINKAFHGIFLLALFGGPAYAQGPVLPQTFQNAIRTAAQPGANNRNNLIQAANVNGVAVQEFVQYVSAKVERKNLESAYAATFQNMLKAAENGRVDEQAGGSASVSGAAGAAVRAGITGLLTGALESGGLTQTLDQSVLTLRANGEGLFRFLSGQDILPVCSSPDDTACDPSPWNNLELGVSLNVSDSNSVTVKGQSPVTGAELAGLVTSNKNQVTAASARFVILNSRDLRSSSYREAWKVWYNNNKASLQPAGVDLVKAVNDVFNAYVSIAAKDSSGNAIKDANGITVTLYDQWLKETQDQLRDPNNSTAEQLTKVVTERLDLLEQQMRAAVPSFDAKIQVAATAYSRFTSLMNEGIQLANKPMLTLEANYSQPTLQPKLVTAKVVFAWSPKGMGTVNRGTVTLNAGVSRYTKPQPVDTTGKTNVWRDAQFALQFDRSMGGQNAPAVFTLGTYVQHQISPGIINIPDGTTAPGTGIPLPGNAKQLLAPKGTIAVVHAGVTLQLPNSGAKIPIGISWSNRTELLQGNEVRGHISFSFDTHSLLLLK